MTQVHQNTTLVQNKLTHCPKNKTLWHNNTIVFDIFKTVFVKNAALWQQNR